MAKRFTDTDKWKREWFCELDLKAKIAWIYLLDQCDHRGVWFRNFKLMSDQLKFTVSADHLKKWFGSKLTPFDGDKYFIPSFVEFQYRDLNPNNNAHKSVILLLNQIAELGPHEDLGSPLGGAQDKVKVKVKVKEKKEGLKKLTTADEIVQELGAENFAALLAMYPEDLIQEEFPRMAFWLANNPPKTNYASFVSTWLKKSLKEKNEAIRAQERKVNTMGLIT